MVVTEVNGDIALSGAGHRCVQLGFLEHRCLRGVRTSHSAPSFDGCRTRVSTSSRWTGLVLKSGLHALDNSCTPFRTVKAELPCKRHAKPDWAQGRLSRTASFCGSACDQQEMWPDAEHLWHIGAAAGDIKYGVPRGRNFPSFLQVRQVSPGPATDCPPRHSRNAQQSIQSPGRPTGQQCPAKPAKVASEFMLLQPCPAQPSPAQRSVENACHNADLLRKCGRLHVAG